MTLLEIHSFIDLITGKETNGYTSPEQKDAALDRASLTLFEHYRKQYGTSIEAKEALAPFRGKYSYTTGADGTITVPDEQNMLHLLAMDVTVSSARYKVDFPNEDELADRLSSQLKAPSATAPVADITGVNTYELFPTQVHTGKVYFLKRPAKPNFDYTIVDRVITEGDSTELEWTEPYLNTVIFLAISYLGIHLDNDKIIQYATQLSAA